jgi:hypothetical protein
VTYVSVALMRDQRTYTRSESIGSGPDDQAGNRSRSGPAQCDDSGYEDCRYAEIEPSIPVCDDTGYDSTKHGCSVDD